MSITITDPVLLAQLRQANAIVELRDPKGNVRGTFAVGGLGSCLFLIQGPVVAV